MMDLKSYCAKYVDTDLVLVCSDGERLCAHTKVVADRFGVIRTAVVLASSGGPGGTGGLDGADERSKKRARQDESAAIVPLQVSGPVMTVLLDVAYKLYTYTPAHSKRVIVEGIPVDWPDHKDHLLALDYLEASTDIMETFSWWLGHVNSPTFKIVNNLAMNMQLYQNDICHRAITYLHR